MEGLDGNHLVIENRFEHLGGESVTFVIRLFEKLLQLFLVGANVLDRNRIGVTPRDLVDILPLDATR